MPTLINHGWGRPPRRRVCLLPIFSPHLFPPGIGEANPDRCLWGQQGTSLGRRGEGLRGVGSHRSGDCYHVGSSLPNTNRFPSSSNPSGRPSSLNFMGYLSIFKCWQLIPFFFLTTVWAQKHMCSLNLVGESQDVGPLTLRIARDPTGCLVPARLLKLW